MFGSGGMKLQLKVELNKAVHLLIRCKRKRKPAVNFIKDLQAAFTCAFPKSAKKTDTFTVFLEPLGSACIKAARKMLVKLTPVWKKK